jgi:hypothetical protein
MKGINTMITVSVTQLLAAIEEADVYKLPDMSTGLDYIYNNLYGRLSRGEDLRLSQINWSSFELDDINTMRDLYSDVIEQDEYKAHTMALTLHGLSPVVAAAVFV